MISRRHWTRRTLVLPVCLTLAACGADGRPPPPGDVNFAEGGAGGGTAGAAFTIHSGGQINATAGSALGSGGAMGGAAGALPGSAGAGGMPQGMEEASCQPSTGCVLLCAAIAGDTACGLGTRTDCVCLCEERINSSCPTQLTELTECIGDSPEVDCRFGGRVFGQCESESFELSSCESRSQEQACATSLPACEALCEPAISARCGQGPESILSCLCGCEEIYEVQCRAQFDAFMACSGQEPVFQCDSNGIPVPDLCVAQYALLQQCQRGEAPDAG